MVRFLRQEVAMRFKRMLVSLLCTVLSLASCGDSAGNRKTVVFSYGRLSPQHEDALRSVVAQFEKKHSDIHVVLHALAPVTDLQRHFYLQSFAAKSAFIDVFEMDTIWSAELAAAGALALPPARLADRLKHFEQQTIAGARYGGKLVAIPSFPAVSMLYYRADLLTKHGLPIPSTWEALLATARRIAQAEGMDGFVWQGARYEGLVCIFLEIYRSHGGTVSVTDHGVTLDARLVATTLGVMKEFLDTGVSPKAVVRYQEAESRARFLSGRAVFARDWDDFGGFIEGDDSEVSGRVGVALLPGTSLHRGVPTLGGWHLAVNAATLVEPEAWALVAELSGAESQAFLAAALGRLPADLHVPLPVRAEMQGTQLVRDALAVAVPRPMSPYYSQFSLLLQEQVHGVLEGTLELSVGAERIVSGASAIDLPPQAGPEFPRSLLNPSTIF
jgi:multiple sugar transport system substrate-binding protein